MRPTAGAGALLDEAVTLVEHRRLDGEQIQPRVEYILLLIFRAPGRSVSAWTIPRSTESPPAPGARTRRAGTPKHLPSSINDSP
jgi:hypothetical protein